MLPALWLRSKAAGVPRDEDELDELIALVLHRLRTPLTAVKGWTQIARRGAEAGVPSEQLMPQLDEVLHAAIVLQHEIDALAAEALVRRDARDLNRPRKVREPVQSEDSAPCPEEP